MPRRRSGPYFVLGLVRSRHIPASCSESRIPCSAIRRLVIAGMDRPYVNEPKETVYWNSWRFGGGVAVVAVSEPPRPLADLDRELQGQSAFFGRKVNQDSNRFHGVGARA